MGYLLNGNKIPSSKSLADMRQQANRVKRVSMIDTVHEIAIYLHRFHNLDLFKQGWYQIKITMRREDDEHVSIGTPARVVQYEASGLASDVMWMINDEENSFSTQPFWIKYERQNALLSIMVTFNLPSNTYEAPSSSAVIIKFELMNAPISEKRSHLQTSLNFCSVSIHEFRIPPKALMGLHSYCPVHFDAFHSVLVDTTVHITHLKSTSSPSKVPRFVIEDGRQNIAYCAPEGVPGKRSSALNQTPELVESVDKNEVKLLKGFLATRDILLEELETLSKTTDLVIDMAAVVSKVKGMEFPSCMQAGLGADDIPRPGKPKNGVEKSNGTEKFRSDISLCPLLGDDFMKSLHSLGDQGLYLWSFFLKLHRVNSVRILEFLRDVWEKDRRAEWSIWMVYTKAEMPRHFISSSAGESPHSIPRRASSMHKLTDDPAQVAVMRAELHRRSIAQMRINNRSVQDMHIFGDPLRIPVVIVEQVVNSSPRATSDKIYFNLSKDPLLAAGAVTKTYDTIQHQNCSVLKIVVFVHGFQGNHLDLRLVRNQWLLVDPRIEFLMSKANEGRTSGDLREMGLRLAQEVVSFVRMKLDRFPRSGFSGEMKLSFVGHSIGNVIIRAALSEPIMEPFLTYLYTYVSISGPHLGYLYSSNSLFNSGLWLLKKLKNTPCIHQLTFTDGPDLRNTFFYKLCKQRTLENFKHIILLSSPQDGYIPYHSARIEPSPASLIDNSKKGRVFLEMLNNCLDQIRAPSSKNRTFMRCDVNFDASAYGNNLNRFIGRAAHIDFLESDVYTMLIMWSFRDLFS